LSGQQPNLDIEQRDTAGCTFERLDNLDPELTLDPDNLEPTLDSILDPDNLEPKLDPDNLELELETVLDPTLDLTLEPALDITLDPELDPTLDPTLDNLEPTEPDPFVLMPSCVVENNPGANIVSLK
jgi:hypothetical protein